MRHDPRIKRVLRRYGSDGYAIYNYVLESIAGSLSQSSPIPALEENSEDIACDLNIDTLRVQEIVGFCLEQELFTKDEITGHILCTKMYKFLDDSTRKSASVVAMLNKFAGLGEPEAIGKIPNKSDKVRVSPNKSEKVREIPSCSVKVHPDIELDLDIEKDLLKDLSDSIEPNTEKIVLEKKKSIVPEIIEFLNETAGRSFKPGTKSTASHINARIKEGFSLDDFKTVISLKTKQWADDPKMACYLRPETLFSPKMDSYLNESPTALKPKNQTPEEIRSKYGF